MTTQAICLSPDSIAAGRYPSAVVLHDSRNRPARHSSGPADGPVRGAAPLPDTVFRVFFHLLLIGTLLAVLALALGDLAVAWQSIRIWVALGALGIVPSAAWLNHHETWQASVPTREGAGRR